MSEKGIGAHNQSTLPSMARPGVEVEKQDQAGAARDNAPAWLSEGQNLMACRCDLCPALGPWEEGADRAEAAAVSAGWVGEKDDELDDEGALVCRTVTWLCPECRA